MKYNDPTLRDMLASEYVLGTLHGRARARFDRLLQQDAALRNLVSQWEQRIGHLHEGVTAKTPHARVWQGIQQRLGFNTGTQQNEAGIFGKLWTSLGFWRGVSVMASTAAIVLAVYLSMFQQPTVLVQQYVAVITNAQQQASWLARADLNNQQIIIKVVNEQTLPLDKAYELWMLPDAGKAPVSMGLLSPDQDKTIILTKTIVTQLKSAQGLAVSLEPAGGSPTGQPTGPVLYQGKLLDI